MERYFRKINHQVSDQIRELRREMAKEFGSVSRVAANVAGPILLWTSRREERRMAAGMTYEPPTILERRNWIEAAEQS